MRMPKHIPSERKRNKGTPKPGGKKDKRLVVNKPKKKKR